MMFCRAITLYWLNYIIDTSRASKGRMLAICALDGSYLFILQHNSLIVAWNKYLYRQNTCKETLVCQYYLLKHNRLYTNK